MRRQLFLIICIYFMFKSRTCHCDCVTKERANFSSAIDVFWVPGTWQLMANTTVLANCTDLDNCTNSANRTDLVNCTNSANCTDWANCAATNSNVTILWNGTKILLQIHYITIEHFQNVHLIFAHEVYNITHDICKAMEIYAAPQNISCTKPVLSKGAVSVSCTTVHISVPMTCSFNSPGLLFQDNVTYTSVSVPPHYYTKVCTLSSRVAILSPGTYVFRVTVDCLLSNSNIGCGSVLTPSLVIDLPKANITLCPNGEDIRSNLIPAGSLATCTCELTSTGYPPGNAMWYSPDNQSLTVTVSNTKAILHLVYNRNSSANQEYLCRAYSELGFSERETNFTPRFAYGPSQVLMSVEPPVINFDLCPGLATEINVTCLVPRESVLPSLNMNIHINNTNFSVANSTDFTNYQRSLRHVFNTSGSYVISCHAQNSLFESLSKVSEQILNVREPPKLPPVILVNETKEYSGVANNSLNLVIGEEVALSCIVRGGFPLNNTTNLTCDDRTVKPAVDGRVIIRWTKGHDVICYCTGFHVTGCYTNSSSKLRLAWLSEEDAVPQSKDESKIGLIIGLSVGLPLAVIVIALVLTCEIKRRISYSRPAKRAARPPGYDTTSLQTTTENQNYASVIISGDQPVIEESSNYYQPQEVESGQNARRVARPDSKEKVVVEKVGTATRITLESSSKGRWQYVRSKITKRSRKSKRQQGNTPLSVGCQPTTEI